MQELLKQLDSKSPIQPAASQAPSTPHDRQQVTDRACFRGAKYLSATERTICHLLRKSLKQFDAHVLFKYNRVLTDP